MKIFKIVLAVLFLLPAAAMADRWCEWSGTQGVNCQSDSRGYIEIPYPDGFKISTESIANSKGYYRVVVTEPSIGADQTKDAEIWALVANDITLTWSVRNLTQNEIDAEDAAIMPLSEYYLWKTLIVTGVITQQQAVNNLPQELIDAYQARDRLENP